MRIHEADEGETLQADAFFGRTGPDDELADLGVQVIAVPLKVGLIFQM